jgi:drug/metabolite transporter (DMT)-like permease
MRPADLAAFRQELTMAGAQHVSVIRQSIAIIGLISIIVLLWGLDPVIARTLLSTGKLAATDLTVIRFFTFFIASSVTYGLHMALSRIKAKPISPFKPSFIASAAALFLTAVLSYIALSDISATQYILFIIAGLVITGMIERILEHRVDLRSMLACVFMAAAIGTSVAIQGYTMLGLLAAAGGSLGFAMYSQLSRRYQETEARIHARYPAFVFWLSLLTLLLTITLVPAMRPLQNIGPVTISFAALFAFVFTFLPYALFFECMR